jgi:5'-3' exonuclease
MIVHLVDGTYELFRHFYGQRRFNQGKDKPLAAVGSLLGTLLGMIEKGATHVGVATDHVIESFRNRMWSGYKTSAGVPADLLAQFTLLEEAITALGVRVWPMIEFEADDALAAAAARAETDAEVEKIFICTPDKDLAQSVRGSRVVQLIRRTNVELDEAAVVKKFGVPPASIPDYLALVGDSADGYPGLPGWGAKSTAAVLARFGKLERIPTDWKEWRVNATSAARLAVTLQRQRDLAFLFRDLATLRTDIPVFDSVAELEWKGPTPAFAALAARFDAAGRKAEG